MSGYLNDAIERWLARKVPVKGSQSCYELPVVLSTDIGLKRAENQDRVSMLRLGASSDNVSQSLIAIVVADGMGGMLDGEKCAGLAVSNFFSSLVRLRSYNLVSRVKMSLIEANEKVSYYSAGNGGATFTALVVDGDGKSIIAHVGDSRAYAFGGGHKTKRLTVDDSLEEFVGGHGRDLLQFVGMGDGISPHMIDLPYDTRNVALTSDGIHFVDSITLEQILYHSLDIKSASERLSALSRWCGGPDNASLAIVELSSISSLVRDSESETVEVWDPFGHAYFNQVNVKYVASVDVTKNANPSDVTKEDGLKRARGITSSRRVKRSRPAKNTVGEKAEIQVEVEVKSYSAAESGDAGRE